MASYFDDNGNVAYSPEEPPGDARGVAIAYAQSHAQRYPEGTHGYYTLRGNLTDHMQDAGYSEFTMSHAQWVAEYIGR